MCNYQSILRCSATHSDGYQGYLPQFSYDAASYFAPRVQSSCVLFHTQWNVVVVIIKCKYLVYPPICYGINFRLATGVNLKLVQSTNHVSTLTKLQRNTLALIILNTSHNQCMHAYIAITVFMFGLHSV